MPGLWKRGTYRDTVIRRITDVPVVGHPLRLRVRMPRYRCTMTSCRREVFAHSTDRLARRGATTTRRCARYILGRLMCFRMTIGAFARDLGLSWDTVNTIALDTPRRSWPPRPPARTACGSAKKADAVLRITLARLSSAFSRLSRFSSAASSLDTPRRDPASISAWRTHIRTVRWFRFPAIPRPRACLPSSVCILPQKDSIIAL